MRRQRAEFEANVQQAPTEELEGAIRFGRLTTSRWKAQILVRELDRRRQEAARLGTLSPPPVRNSPVQDALERARVEATGRRPTARQQSAALYAGAPGRMEAAREATEEAKARAFALAQVARDHLVNWKPAPEPVPPPTAWKRLDSLPD
jgi:hypothetical protein